MTETSNTTTDPQPSLPSTWQSCGTCGQRHDPRADHSAAKASDADPLDPIGYDDALLIRAALLRFADHMSTQIADLPEPSQYREAWTNDLIRVRWLAERSWYRAVLCSTLDGNDRDHAMRQLELIAGVVPA